jgi:hypothetical protein
MLSFLSLYTGFSSLNRFRRSLLDGFRTFLPSLDRDTFTRSGDR